MTEQRCAVPQWSRRLVAAGVAMLGLIGLVGSGGGVADEWGGGGCRRETSSGDVDPQRAVVSAGDSITLTARPDFPAIEYSWRRCRQGSCVELAVTSGDTYTLAGARLEDDGSSIVVVADGCWWVSTSSARIEVRPSPGIAYADSAFVPGDWEATPLPDDAGVSSVAFVQAAAGGQPGAFAAIGYRVLPPTESWRVFHGSLKSIYDPQVQGAVHAVDFALDCRWQRAEGGVLSTPRKAFVQAGRWYQAISVPWAACPFQWGAALDRTSLSLDSFDFELVAGPPCGAGETCPDPSATGAPIRFGFIVVARRDPAAAVAAIDHDIDNWQVTVWRR